MSVSAGSRASTSFDAALRTHDLEVGYRTRGTRRTVLEHVNLAVDSGDLVCLLGPNGIGKSTLLRTIAGMQPLLSGSVELSGADLASISHAELGRRVGVVLTERVVVEALTVSQIVGLGRYAHSGWFGRLTDRDRAAVEWAIKAIGVRHLADRDFSRLSDGERQRVMIARALAQEPALMLLDEPTAFLDVPSRIEMMGLLRQLTRERPLAVVVSTHDLELALRTADQIWLLMPAGKLIAGAPEDVVLSGAIAEAFEGRGIRFRPAERSFQLSAGNCGEASVHGAGLRSVLTAAVLEREGYEVVASDAPAVALSVEALDSGWRLSAKEGECSGPDFASLADYLRGRRARS